MARAAGVAVSQVALQEAASADTPGVPGVAVAEVQGEAVEEMAEERESKVVGGALEV